MQKTYPLECVDLLKRAKAAFQTGCTTKESFRLAQLEALVRMLGEHECDFVDALGRDLHKVWGKVTALCDQHAVVFPCCSTTLDDCLVVSEPLGVVLIMGTWCSPVLFCLGPLVGAIAAGNCAVISPSEHTSHTAELLHRLVPSYLDSTNDLADIVELKFDHVFFVGTDEIVAQAAARTFTPVTLILGGKNPCYVDQQCDITATAQRIAWARFHNAGQSVVAPDYVLSPTILTEVVETDPIMQHDVFGPVLPVLTVNTLDEAITFINKQEKPLCVYAYSSNSKVISRLMSETSSGSFCSNDSVLQSVMVGLPFGGVGASGMGSYHGRYSFDAFSHRKSCLLRGTRFECVTYLRYPPYEDRNLSLMTWASTLSQKSQGWCQIL
uniref:Aldehyde dehydrogenase 3 family, member B2 n=1 Tax=Myripristis murdjan TaxID=586833 RepID=A0A667ZFV9_9TELE